MLDQTALSGSGVPHGEELLAFVSEAQYGGAGLDNARKALRSALGDDAVLEAAATVAIFNGLVRVADGTGIQLDSGVLSDSLDYRERLGIDKYGGAANSDSNHLRADVDRRSISDLFR